jgi:hypothetical protein
MKHCKNLIVLQEELTKERRRSLKLYDEFSRGASVSSYVGPRALVARSHVSATLV